MTSLLMPSEERFQTMSLGSRGPSTIPNGLRNPRTHEANRTDDIEGARSELKYTRYTRRPNFYETGDIAGTAPRTLHRPGEHADLSLVTRDIEGAYPRPMQFRTDRQINPLMPEYELPSCVPAAVVVPKFVRDGFSIGDIEGTAPRARFRFAQRETYDCKDIEGTASGWRPRNERVRRDAPPRDSLLDVHDINDPGFKTRRVTDPLRPEFFVHGMLVQDDPVRTRPRKLPAQHAGPYNPLYTDDIEGAQCGWKPPHEMQPPLEKRRQFRNTNYISDIKGAQSDTVKHSIQTQRHTNPLDPHYRSLDGDPLLDPTKPDYSHLLPPRPESTQKPAYDRLVLRSSDGKPRVLNSSDGQLPLRSSGGRALYSSDGQLPPRSSGPRTASPSMRREAAQLAADLRAVQDL